MEASSSHFLQVSQIWAQDQQSQSTTRLIRKQSEEENHSSWFPSLGRPSCTTSPLDHHFMLLQHLPLFVPSIDWLYHIYVLTSLLSLPISDHLLLSNVLQNKPEKNQNEKFIQSIVLTIKSWHISIYMACQYFVGICFLSKGWSQTKSNKMIELGL